MEEFRFLYTIKFNNKKFWVLTNETYRFYILEILENGKLTYPEYDDYIGFICEFKNFSSKNLNRSDLKENDERRRNFLERSKGILRLIPRVVKNGIIISAMSALIIAGIAGVMKINEAFVEHKQAELVEMYIKEAQRNDCEVEYIPELEKYIFKSYIDSETNKKVIVCTTNDELKEYFPEKNQNPTYEDVIRTIRQNENIPDEFKEQYIDALKKLKELMPGIDLFVLNLNAERMSVRVVENIKIKNTVGVFHKETGEIEYEENPKPLTIIHELIHAMIGGEFKLQDGTIVEKTFKFPEITFNIDPETIQMTMMMDFIGVTTEEYLADKLAEILIGEKRGDGSYLPTDWQWEMYRLACNYSYQELINNGTRGLIDAMVKNDVDLATEVVRDADSLLWAIELSIAAGEPTQYLENGITISSTSEKFWNDWLEEKVQRGESNLEGRIVECIMGAGCTDRVAYPIINEDPWEVIWVDSLKPQEFAERVIAKLNELESNPFIGIRNFFESDER